MPNQNIHPAYAAVTTHRSNSTATFFDLPKDATPQDCKEITGKLLTNAHAVLSAVNLDGQSIAKYQINAVLDLLIQAAYANDLLNIEQAVLMA